MVVRVDHVELLRRCIEQRVQNYFTLSKLHVYRYRCISYRLSHVTLVHDMVIYIITLNRFRLDPLGRMYAYVSDARALS